MENGLTSAQAQAKIKKFGSNLLPEEKTFSPFWLLVRQFQNPLIYILIFAGGISLLLKELKDSVIIFLAVIVNAIFGFYQEFKAEKALLALKKILPQKSRVIRDGQAKEVDVSEIVPGDLLVLVQGEKVAADGKVIEVFGLSADESILTGESNPVKKVKADPVYKGTTILTGHGKMIVTKTGIKTEFGQIAQGLKTQKEEETPLQKRLSDLGKSLGVFFLGICLLIFLAGLILGNPVFLMLETAVAVAVGAIPEGLAISLTVILTVAMRRLLAKKVLVRKLVAAETLGATSVICTDKTGTITEGLMRVVKEELADKKIAYLGSVLCNNLHDSEEISLWQWAKGKDHFDPQREFETRKKVFEIPFSSERRFMLTVNRFKKNGKVENFAFIKGAPEVIFKHLGQCPELEEWEKLVAGWATEGLRVMALGYKQISEEIPRKDHHSLDFFGKFKPLAIFGFEDPIREGVKPAFDLCRSAGIKVKIITGDYRGTAEAVAKKLGFKVNPEEILDGKELEALSPSELEEAVAKAKLFVRVKPQQKYKIVESLKNRGEVVAVTGDGVNDALALKKADIGIVVAEGTEVAKETADMVLLESNFSAIVQAVYEGRVIFENIRKVLIYLLSDSFTEVILILSSLLLSLPLPILPVQILWVNLFNDSLPHLALAFEKEDKGILTQPPRKLEEPFLNSEAKVIIFIVGIITDFLLLGIFLWFYRVGYDLGMIRSFVFAALGIDSLLYIFSCKSFRKNLWEINIFENKKLIVSVLVSFALLYSAFYFPFLTDLLRVQKLMSWEWGLLFVFGLVDIILIEAVKYLYIKTKVDK